MNRAYVSQLSRSRPLCPNRLRAPLVPLLPVIDNHGMSLSDFSTLLEEISVRIGAKATTAAHSCAAVTPCQVAKTGDASSARRRGLRRPPGRARQEFARGYRCQRRAAKPGCLRSGGRPNAVWGRRPLRRREPPEWTGHHERPAPSPAAYRHVRRDLTRAPQVVTNARMSYPCRCRL